jgi:sugar lactone lactonase YvrE
MRRLLWISLALVALAALYFTLAPIPIAPRAYEAPPSRGYSGPFARNSRLSALTRIDLGGGAGPEDGAVDVQGHVHFGLRDGAIVRVDPKTFRATRWADTSGVPLGLEFDERGTLWVADAYRGLLSIATSGAVTVRATTAGGVPIRYADDVAVSRDGIVYFSDASTKFGAQAFGGTLAASFLDLMEHVPHGRILRYDPQTGQTAVVRRGLYFANGVALSADERTLLVAETAMNRVLALRLRGPRAGALDVLIDALPGFPDNIDAGADGRFWVGLVAPRSRELDALAGRPGMRTFIQRLPAGLRPKETAYSHVFAIDAGGRVLHDLQDPSAAFTHTTGAIESAGTLFVTSLTEPAIAHMPWPAR